MSADVTTTMLADYCRHRILHFRRVWQYYAQDEQTAYRAGRFEGLELALLDVLHQFCPDELERVSIDLLSGER